MEKNRKSKGTSKKSPQPIKQYNPYLDVLKGFAILLVVLGHSLQTHLANGTYDQNIIFRIIYSFHMPLFMFLAGAAGAYSLRPMNWDFVKRKFYMLAVPFITWGLIDYYLSGVYHHQAFKTYIHQLILFPDNGLWFLWVLFLNFAVLALISKLKRWFGLYSYLIVWLAVYALPTSKFGIGFVKWQLPFFAIGYLIFSYRHQLAKYRFSVLSLCVVTAPILVGTWHRLYFPNPVVSLEPRLVAHGLQKISIGDLSSLNTYNLIALIYMYAVPLSAIGFVYWILQLKRSQFLWKLFNFFGLYTLEVYALNLILLRYGFGHSWVMVGSSFAISSVLSVAIGLFVLRRVSILSILFLGGRTKPAALTLKK